MRFLTYVALVSFGLLSASARPGAFDEKNTIEARQASGSDPSSVISQLQTNASTIITMLQNQLDTGNGDSKKNVESELDQLAQVVGQAATQLGAAPAVDGVSASPDVATESFALPDTLGLVSSILTLVSSIVGLAGTNSTGTGLPAGL